MAGQVKRQGALVLSMWMAAEQRSIASYVGVTSGVCLRPWAAAGEP